jgi:AraC-like DNA-binding protein
VDATIESFLDIDEQASRLVGYDQHYQQQGRGRFRGQFLTQHLAEDVSIFIEQCNLPLLQRGSVPAGVVTLQFLLAAGADCILNGQRFSTDSVVMMAGGSSFDHVSSADMRICVVHLPAAVVEDLLPAVHADTLFVRDPELSARLRRLVTAAVNRRASAEVLLAAEFGSIAREFIFAHRPRPGRSRIERAVFSRALSVIDAQLDWPLRIPELCRSIGVSRRTLENAFRTHLGHGPAKHIRLARLNAVRRALSTGAGSTSSIGDIAAGVGIWHLGRLAKDFRELFGQRPRELLPVSESRSGPQTQRSEAD